MTKKIVLFFVFLSFCSNITFAESSIDFNHFKVIKFDKAPLEYTQELEKINKPRFSIPEKDWKIKVNENITLEGKVVGKKEFPETGPFKTSEFYIYINGKKIVIEKDCFGFGNISWDKSGKQIFYQKIKNAPMDFPNGEFYLINVDIDGQSINTKKITANIGFTNLGWAKENNIVAFSDYYAVYLYHLNDGNLKRIVGSWASEVKSDGVGSGYPRYCSAFIWLNKDRELYFRYQKNVFGPEYYEYYKIAF